MQRKWLASPAPRLNQTGKVRVWHHQDQFGELPGFNSFIGHDPANDATLIVWTNLTLSAEGQMTANAVMLKALDQNYVESPPKSSSEVAPVWWTPDYLCSKRVHDAFRWNLPA